MPARRSTCLGVGVGRWTRRQTLKLRSDTRRLTGVERKHVSGPRSAGHQESSQPSPCMQGSYTLQGRLLQEVTPVLPGGEAPSPPEAPSEGQGVPPLLRVAAESLPPSVCPQRGLARTPVPSPEPTRDPSPFSEAKRFSTRAVLCNQYQWFSQSPDLERRSGVTRDLHC